MPAPSSARAARLHEPMVRAVHADEQGTMAAAVREVAKYCTKLTEVSSREREDGESDVLELHRAIRGRRLLTTVGVFRGLAEPEKAEELVDDPENQPCPTCGRSWQTVTAVWDQGVGGYVLRVVVPRGAWGRPPNVETDRWRCRGQEPAAWAL